MSTEALRQPTEDAELDWIAAIPAHRRENFDANRSANVEEMALIIGTRLADAAAEVGALGVALSGVLYEQAAQIAEQMRHNFELGAQVGIDHTLQKQTQNQGSYTGLHAV